MKNKKRNIGKIALLTAAMAVTVPSAVLLSACGGNSTKECDKEHAHVAGTTWQTNAEAHWHKCGTNANDNHSFDLASHTFVQDGTEYKCSVCNYVKTPAVENPSVDNTHVAATAWKWNNEAHWHGCETEEDDKHSYDLADHEFVEVNGEYKCSVCGYVMESSVNDIRIQTLKAAWENMVNYKGAVTMSSLGSDEGTVRGQVISYNPTTGEGSCYVKFPGVDGTMNRMLMMAVYKNAAGDYVACLPNNEYDPESEDNNNQYNYYKVNEHYFVENMTDDGYSMLDYVDPTFSNIYSIGSMIYPVLHGVNDMASFEANALKMIADSLSGKIDDNNTKVTIEEEDGVLTVTAHAQTVAANDGSYESADMIFTVKNGLLTSVVAQMGNVTIEENEDGEEVEVYVVENVMQQFVGLDLMDVETEEPEVLKMPTVKFNLTINKNDELYEDVDLASIALELEYGNEYDWYYFQGKLKALILEKIEGLQENDVIIDIDGFNFSDSLTASLENGEYNVTVDITTYIDVTVYYKVSDREEAVKLTYSYRYGSTIGSSAFTTIERDIRNKVNESRDDITDSYSQLKIERTESNFETVIGWDNTTATQNTVIYVLVTVTIG